MAGLPTTGELYAARYQVTRQLGVGGTSASFEALDLEHDQSVALKIFRPPTRARAALHQRLEGEATLLATVDSEHLIPVLDEGIWEDTVYFAAPHFPEGDLGTWLRGQGAPERRTALLLSAQVCEGLAAAHARGILHRDLKPAHVLLSRWAAELAAHLCAFGIGLDGVADLPVTAGLPHTGMLVGDPASMAPERHLGAVADIRADVYSAGCVLWAALTGEPPYRGTAIQVINAHLNAPVPALASGDPMDQRIDEVLGRALAKDPDQRIGSAATLAAELRDLAATLR